MPGPFAGGVAAAAAFDEAAAKGADSFVVKSPFNTAIVASASAKGLPLHYELDRTAAAGGAPSAKISPRRTTSSREDGRVATLMHVSKPGTYHTNFSVTSAEWSDEEFMSVIPAQDGSQFVQSATRSNRALTVHGILLNSDRAEWFREWMTRYERDFRSSVMVRRRDVHQLTLDGVQHYGLVARYSGSINTDSEAAAQFSFVFVVMDMRALAAVYVDLVDERTYVSADIRSALPKIGYVRGSVDPSNPALGALGAMAEYAMDPAKWAALASANTNKTAALAGMASGMGSSYVAAAGNVTGNAATDSLIQTLSSNGFSSEATLAIATGNLDADTGLKMAELGLEAGENALKAATAGSMFGVGEEYTPGKAYDASTFSSQWSHLANMAMNQGFSAIRMGLSRARGGTSALNFGERERTKNAISVALWQQGSTYASDSAVVCPQASGTETTEQALELASSTTTYGSSPVGPLLDFVPSQENETATNPVAVTAVSANNQFAGPIIGI